jgi:hypothetical protein
MIVNPIGGRRLDKFLFCIELETGGMTIGWLGFISSIVSLALCIAFLVAMCRGVFSNEDFHHMGLTENTDYFDEKYFDSFRTGENHWGFR